MSQRVRPSVVGSAPAARSAAYLAVAAAAALASGAMLLARAVHLGRDVLVLLDVEGGAGRAVATTRVEDVVEATAVLVGLAVAGWLALGLTTAACCAAACVLGRRWRLGEQIVARTAPAVVRRAVALSAGTGIALAGAGLPASADVAPPPVDLGWAPTVSAPAWPASPASGPPGPAAVPPVVDGAEGGEPAAPSGSAATVPTAPVPPGTSTDAASGAVEDDGLPDAPPGSPPQDPPDASAAEASPAMTATASSPGGVPGGSPHQGAPAAASGTRAAAPTGTPEPPSSSPAHAAPAAAVASAVPKRAGLSVGSASPSVAVPAAAPPAGEAAAGGGDTAPTGESAHHGSAAPAVVTVRPGDTLWGIASDFLPADAGAQEVARAWPRWYAANRAVIGTDPGLIRPGQQLVSPAGDGGGEQPAPAPGAGS